MPEEDRIKVMIATKRKNSIANFTLYRDLLLEEIEKAADDSTGDLTARARERFHEKTPAGNWVWISGNRAEYSHSTLREWASGRMDSDEPRLGPNLFAYKTVIRVIPAGTVPPHPTPDQFDQISRRLEKIEAVIQELIAELRS